MRIFDTILTLTGVIHTCQSTGSANDSRYSVVFRLTQKGLTYAISTLLEREKVPKYGLHVNETAAGVNYYIERLDLVDFTNRNASAALDPDPPRLNLTIHDLSAKLQGQVQCTALDSSEVRTQNCTMEMEVRVSGHFLSHIGRDGGVFNISLARKDCYFRPPGVTVNFTQCDRPDESLCDRGAANFTEQFKEKELSMSKLCLILMYWINRKGNTRIKKIDLIPNIATTPFGINLSVTEDPEYTNQYLNTYLKGEVFWLSTNEKYGFTPMPFEMHNKSSRMAYLWVSKSVTESFFNGIQMHGMLHKRITAEKVGSGLNTTCSKGVCVGRLVPELGRRFPNQYMDLEVYSIDNPTVKFEKNLATLSGDMVMFASIRDPNPKTPHTCTGTIARLTGKLDIRITAWMGNLTLHGRVVSMEPTIQNIYSDFPEMNDAQTINFILIGAVVVTIEPKLNEIGAKGLKLPVENVVLYNTTVDLIENAIVLGGDVNYTGHHGVF